MRDRAPTQLEHLSSLSFYDDSFAYKSKSYPFDDVAHIKFTATKTRHSVNFVRLHAARQL